MQGSVSCSPGETIQLSPPTVAPNQADDCAWSFLDMEELEDEQPVLLRVLRSGTCQTRRVCSRHTFCLSSMSWGVSSPSLALWATGHLCNRKVCGCVCVRAGINYPGGEAWQWSSWVGSSRARKGRASFLHQGSRNSPHLYSSLFWGFPQVAVGGASWWKNKSNQTPDFLRKGGSLLN